MENFDDIYTISDDSDYGEHVYVPRKGLLESLYTNKKALLFVGIPLIILGAIGIIILLKPQPIVINVIQKNPSNNPVAKTSAGSNLINSSNNQQTNTSNLVQGLVNTVGSLFHANPVGVIRKPNWETYPAGTILKAQKSSTNNGTSTVQTYGTPSVSQSNQGVQNNSQPIPTPIYNDIQLVFKDTDGKIEVYQPPSNPPADIVWGRYVNTQDRYSIDYPTNWQMVKTMYNGHEGISLYLPGANIDQNPEYIGFGWAIYYLLPTDSNITTAYSSPITVSTVNGILYTQGALGFSYIASVFQYQNGSWGLGTSISDPTFAYVYDHMINSLIFNE